MLSSSISSSSSSSSRSISLSPESSCRKTNRIHGQFSPQMEKHLCQLRSNGWCCWLTLHCFLPCALCNHTSGGYREGSLSGLVWIQIWTRSGEQQQILQELFFQLRPLCCCLPKSRKVRAQLPLGANGPHGFHQQLPTLLDSGCSIQLTANLLLHLTGLTKMNSLTSAEPMAL